MQDGLPSRTARGAAAHRAAHQVLEGGRIFTDPFAFTLLDADAGDIVTEAANDPSRRNMRLFIASRSRLAEDALSAAVLRGVHQAVFLGAGLDTFALRNPYVGLVVFEVDHPATQAWKRGRFKQAGLQFPGSLKFAPTDFETQNIADGLLAAGFQKNQPAIFVWLGVVMYLSRNAIFGTLDFVSDVPASEVVFDYLEPLDNYPSDRRASLSGFAARTAESGEPWISNFDPEELSRELRHRGFDEIEDLDFASVGDRFFNLPQGVSAGSGGHVIRARKIIGARKT